MGLFKKPSEVDPVDKAFQQLDPVGKQPFHPEHPPEPSHHPPFNEDTQFRLDVLLKLDQIIELLKKLAHFQETIKVTVDDLAVQVAANTTVESSAITLIQGIAAQLAAAGTDPVKLQALNDQLKASSDALAAAVAANTPAAPPAPVPPTA